jgi:hypothetical protein
MKLEDCRNAYYEFSRKTCEISRNLAFAGVAVVWLFREVVNTAPSFPVPLRPALFFLASTLALNLLHAISGTIIWGTYHRVLEYRHIPDTKDFKAPRWLNCIPLFLFWAMVGSILSAYILLIRFLIIRCFP